MQFLRFGTCQLRNVKRRRFIAFLAFHFFDYTTPRQKMSFPRGRDVFNCSMPIWKHSSR
jgi:hypothetical protein